jgi:hypothetical protein
MLDNTWTIFLQNKPKCNIMQKPQTYYESGKSSGASKILEVISRDGILANVLCVKSTTILDCFDA